MTGKRYNVIKEKRDSGIAIIRYYGNEESYSWFIYADVYAKLDLISSLKLLMGMEKRSEDEIIIDNFNHMVDINYNDRVKEADRMNKQLDEREKFMEKIKISNN
jgi:hypothetical protein